MNDIKERIKLLGEIENLKGKIQSDAFVKTVDLQVCLFSFTLFLPGITRVLSPS
jgi:hypothetical protein